MLEAWGFLKSILPALVGWMQPRQGEIDPNVAKAEYDYELSCRRINEAYRVLREAEDRLRRTYLFHDLRDDRIGY